MKLKIIVLPVLIIAVLIAGAVYLASEAPAEIMSIKSASFLSEVDIEDELNEAVEKLGTAEPAVVAERIGNFTAFEAIDKENAENGENNEGENAAAPLNSDEPREFPLYTMVNDELEIAVIVDGLPDTKLLDGIIKGCKESNLKLTVFVEGLNALNEPDSVDKIRKAGFGVGNFTFNGRGHAEEMAEKDFLKSLLKTQKVLKNINKFAPQVFRAPRSAYSRTVLKLAGAAGLRYAIRETRTYPLQAINGQAKADSFVKSLSYGDVILIPIAEPIVERKITPHDERPAVDKKPTIKDSRVNKFIPNDEKELMSLEYLFKALKEAGFKS